MFRSLPEAQNRDYGRDGRNIVYMIKSVHATKQFVVQFKADEKTQEVPIAWVTLGISGHPIGALSKDKCSKHICTSVVSARVLLIVDPVPLSTHMNIDIYI